MDTKETNRHCITTAAACLRSAMICCAQLGKLMRLFSDEPIKFFNFTGLVGDLASV